MWSKFKLIKKRWETTVEELTNFINNEYEIVFLHRKNVLDLFVNYINEKCLIV